MTLSTSTDQTVILSGDRTKLKDLLRVRLNECGWTDQVRLMCRDILKEDNNPVTVDQLVEEVTPMARKIIPDQIKKELLAKIKNTLLAQYSD